MLRSSTPMLYEGEAKRFCTTIPASRQMHFARSDKCDRNMAMAEEKFADIARHRKLSMNSMKLSIMVIHQTLCEDYEDEVNPTPTLQPLDELVIFTHPALDMIVPSSFKLACSKIKRSRVKMNLTPICYSRWKRPHIRGI